MEYWNAGSKLKKLKRFVSLIKRFEDANNFNVFLELLSGCNMHPKSIIQPTFMLI